MTADTPTRADHRRARSAARLAAVQALFQMEQSDQDVDAVRAEFETHRFGQTLDGETLEEAEPALFRATLDTAVDHQREIDRLADRALSAAWPIDRIDPTLRALFRAAGAELILGQTPPRVVVNEYVDVAHAFFPEGREAAFVNGVLDSMAHAARPEAF